MTIPFRVWSRRSLGLAVVIAILGSLGCGKIKMVNVSGQVTYNGKPVPGGLITFRPADPKQNSVSAELDEQGNFSVILPSGEVSVLIDNRELAPRPAWTFSGVPPGLKLPPEVVAKLGSAKGKAEPPPEIDPTKTADAPRPKSSGRYLRIPEKYHDLEQSGLKFTVEGGNQTKNIELTD
jgi:hypothetical protein